MSKNSEIKELKNKLKEFNEFIIITVTPIIKSKRNYNRKIIKPIGNYRIYLNLKNDNDSFSIKYKLANGEGNELVNIDKEYSDIESIKKDLDGVISKF